jgi:hypothetical protein
MLPVLIIAGKKIIILVERAPENIALMMSKRLR